MDGIITITDGHTRTVKAPYQDGEKLSDVLKRTIRFKTPCGGIGGCGRCIVDVIRADGREKRELACGFELHEDLTVIKFPLRPIDDTIEVIITEPADTKGE